MFLAQAVGIMILMYIIMIVGMLFLVDRLQLGCICCIIKLLKEMERRRLR